MKLKCPCCGEMKDYVVLHRLPSFEVGKDKIAVAKSNCDDCKVLNKKKYYNNYRKNHMELYRESVRHTKHYKHKRIEGTMLSCL